MDQKRMFLAIALSIAILLGWQFVVRPMLPAPPAPVVTSTPEPSAGQKPAATASAAAMTATAAVPREVPRVAIDAPRVHGSIALLGARIDDVVLRDYRETIAPDSPQVRVLEPAADAQPYYVQFGWTLPPGAAAVKLPDGNSLWTATSAGPLTATHPLTLAWDNGAGLAFEIAISIDDNYMFQVSQSVRNATAAGVELLPWARIKRDYTPTTEGYYILHEGMLGVLNGRLQETKYSDAKKTGEAHDGVAYSATSTGGWAGFTDKYWLVALVPDQTLASAVNFRHVSIDGHDGYQVDLATAAPQAVAAGATATASTRLFAGAKVVRLLDRYESADNIPNFDKAVDFGWFYFLTKPMFYALDFLYGLFGNFGLAIMGLTICVKALFFPLANKAYRSMSRMKTLAPKIQALRERLKDDPAKMQSEMMALYRAEKVNPASGCLPMVVQIPVFFSLYKVIFVTIEMRQAPFFGWIHDLSAIDPTNIFNLFGLLPFDPGELTPFLHLGVWPVIMGVTMWLQQKMNPPPPDPVQAKMFQFMPLIFTFMLARFPAGLVIYWSWNNTLTVLQQWLIMRQTKRLSATPARG